MFHKLKRIFKKRDHRSNRDIDPDEIFLDSKNLPNFDTNQFEGLIEKPISHTVLGLTMFFIIFVGTVLVYKVWNLQIINGQTFRTRSENNSLHKTLVFADRGVIYDRNKIPLAWNDINPATSDFSLRVYATSTGLSTVLGYVKYPTKDSGGFYYQDSYSPKDGIEKIYNDKIAGKNGTQIIETDVRGNVVSESVVEKPVDGDNLDLSVDVDLQKELNKSLLDLADRAGFKGGAGVIMNIHTGELLASSNFPEYESGIMTNASNNKKINEWLTSKSYPFLNRVVDGLYTPGSIMKVFIAMGVLDQGVIDPSKQILSTGSITIPNPFFPDKPSTFLDWKAHGWVDLRHALAVSSNVYFYEVGGGYKDQKGIGITNIEKYTRMFGFGSTTQIYFPGENAGTIPSPEWKKENFKGEDWRIGDTYNTAIGQYGFQASPIQVVRAISAIANEGTLLTPTFTKIKSADDIKVSGKIDLNPNFYTIVKEGMRLCVKEGTCQALNLPFVEIAAKTGTAQLGISKDEVNSWVIGFWPYKNPKYAFAVVMERGSKNNQFGAVGVMSQFFDWVNIYDSNYLK